MSGDTSFDDLMARLRAGDEDAAARVLQRFTQRLIALARSRLNGPLRRKVDPEDVLQSVYKSFFLRHRDGQFDLENWEGLWALLTVLTLRKCGRWVERFHTEGRDVDRESPPPSDSWQAMAREPTPEEAAMLTETVERLLQGLEGRERAMVSLALQGHTVVEIAAEVGTTRRTVQRVLKRVKERLNRGV